MISYKNPVKEHLMPGDIDRSELVPKRYAMRNGRTISYLSDSRIGLVKMDFIFEAGTALQQKPLQAATAIKMIAAGTAHHTVREIAEFLDFRGIIIEKNIDTVSATLTAYALPRYVGELLPLLHELLFEASYPDSEFELHKARERRRLQENQQRTSAVARNAFYRSLYGAAHPLGRYAVVADADALCADDVRRFHGLYYEASRMDIVLGGAVTDEVLAAFDCVFGGGAVGECERVVMPEPAGLPSERLHLPVEGAAQTTLRVGRLLPMRWDEREYAEFMVLSTILGGYFGSRLMSNIREDKGYTYGINAMTLVQRGSLVFFIASDVSADKAEPALKEIGLELERLGTEPVGSDELELVRRCMLGDFMRSVDGIFERSERICQMLSRCIDERFTDNYMSVLEPGGITAERLQELARQLLQPQELAVVTAGRG